MTKRLPLAVALSAFAMACSDPSGLTTPTRTLVPSTSSLALNPVPGYPFPSSTVTTEPNETDGLVRLCKISNTAGTFTFNVTVNALPSTQVQIAIGAGQLNTRVCAASALFNSDLPSASVDQVLIVEVDPGVGVTTTVDIDQYFISGISYHANALADQFNVAPRTARVFINDDMEKRVTFTNTTQPLGGEGCTPGYWKNHEDSWPATGFAPGATLESVFNVPDAYGLDNVTLLNALSLKGGSTVAEAAAVLLHHAVAALLNAGHPDVDYAQTAASIITGVNAALATGNRDTMLALKSTLDSQNNAGCTIN